MKSIRLMMIPDDGSPAKNIRIPYVFIKSLTLGTATLLGFFTYLAIDYYQLIGIKTKYQLMSSENAGLKSEAKLLMSNLDQVKRSLEKVQTYSTKLQAFTNFQYKKISKQTGIGPLTDAEYKKQLKHVTNTDAMFHPLGINFDKLTFQPVFNKLRRLETSANNSSIKLQHLLSNLSQKKSLLSSIPSISPVNGWITSGFGARVSPFTGLKGSHNGIDLASPIGTPIIAPADGVVIFAGAKAGFGNFIMVAHGNGVISRYGHNAENMVKPGQKLSKGEQIGTVGMTGRTTGPHLHYEIVINGKNVNPRKFMLNM